jgi:hypothetical protein
MGNLPSNGLSPRTVLGGGLSHFCYQFGEIPIRLLEQIEAMHLCTDGLL